MGSQIGGQLGCLGWFLRDPDRQSGCRTVEPLRGQGCGPARSGVRWSVRSGCGSVSSRGHGCGCGRGSRLPRPRRGTCCRRVDGRDDRADIGARCPEVGVVVDVDHGVDLELGGRRSERGGDAYPFHVSPPDRAGAIEATLVVRRLLATEGAFDEVHERELATAAIDRSFDPAGIRTDSSPPSGRAATARNGCDPSKCRRSSSTAPPMIWSRSAAVKPPQRPSLTLNSS